jgi:hypothetical protein
MFKLDPIDTQQPHSSCQTTQKLPRQCPRSRMWAPTNASSLMRTNTDRISRCQVLCAKSRCLLVFSESFVLDCDTVCQSGEWRLSLRVLYSLQRPWIRRCTACADPLMEQGLEIDDILRRWRTCVEVSIATSFCETVCPFGEPCERQISVT